MAHAESPSLISLGLASDVSQEHSSFRWGLATSCLLHALMILLAIFLRFQATIEEPLRTIDVALITLPEAETPAPRQEKSAPRTPAPQKAEPSPPKVQPAPLPNQPQPMEEVIVPLPTQTASERLSDFLGGAIGSIVVPERQEVTSPVMSSQNTDPILPKNKAPLIENLRLPTTAPQLSRPERLHPSQRLNIPEDNSTPPRQTARSQSALAQPKESESIPPPQKSAKMERAVNQAPALPELSPVTPFHKTEQETPNDLTSSTNMAKSLKESLPTLPTPLPTPTIHRKSKPTRQQPKKSAVPEMSAPQLAKIQPSPPLEKFSQPVKPAPQPVKPPPQRVNPPSKRVHSPPPTVNNSTAQMKPTPPLVEQTPPREKMSKMMEQLLGEVQMPTLKSQPATPLPQQHASSSIPSVKPAPSEIDQRIAKLSIPTVTSRESIRHRLQQLEVEYSSNSNSSSHSRSQPSSGKYLAEVTAILQDQWEKTPLVADAPAVELKFRITRSGEISQIRIVKSSGNEFYDSAALRTVHAVNPLPPFPPDVSESSFEVGSRFKRIKEKN